MNIRQKKISEEIKRVVSEYFIINALKKCGNSLVTITKVDISPDLRNVKIFISILNVQNDIEQEECFNAIIKNRKQIKKAISDNLALRNIPEITIKKDESYNKAEKIKRLLRDIK